MPALNEPKHATLDTSSVILAERAFRVSRDTGMVEETMIFGCVDRKHVFKCVDVRAAR